MRKLIDYAGGSTGSIAMVLLCRKSRQNVVTGWTVVKGDQALRSQCERWNHFSVVGTSRLILTPIKAAETLLKWSIGH